MPRDSSGTYTLPQTAFQPNTTISSSSVNSDLGDVATALTQSIASTGVTTPSAPIPFIAGTSSAPGVTHVSDSTSGIYNPAVGQEAIVAGAVGVLVSSLAYYCSAAPVAAGGTGYVVGDRITLTGGTYVTPVTLTVATLSGSAVATVSITTPGRYTAQPTNPVSQGSTTGSGSGATFTLTFTAALLVTDLTGANLGQSIGASPYATNTLLQLASASDLQAAVVLATIAVSGGGTGKTTLVPYAPIFGGITSTGVVQSGTAGTSGQVLTSNGPSTIASFQTITSPSITGVVDIRTASSTITIPTGATKLKVTLVGGGGGGGGCAAAAPRTGGSGGAAAVCIKYLSSLTPGGTLALTIGAAGAAGASGANAGTSGGDTTLASGTQSITTLTAAKGILGGAGTDPFGANGAGGASTNGDLNISGGDGKNFYFVDATDNANISFMEGGSNVFGQGGWTGGSTNSHGAGQAGKGYGAGGSGAYTLDGTANAGGAGSAGCAIFEWYI